MKEMKKKIKILPVTAILLTSLLTGMLSGCQSSPQQASTSSAAAGDSDKPVTITLMQQNTPDKVYFNTMIEDFRKLHPNVTIKMVQVPYDQFDSKLQTMIAANTQPDITTNVQTMGFMDYYTKGLLTDLTPYVQKYGFDNKKYGIPEAVMKNCVIDGKTYAIPLNTFTSVLLYNKDLFDKAGIAYPPSSYDDTSWTFDKMVDTAKKLTSGSGADATFGLVWDWSAGMQNVNYFGKGLFPDSALKTGYADSNNLRDPQVIDSIQRIADLALVDKVEPTPDVMSAMSGSNQTDPFMTGKIAMEVEGAWCLSGVNELPFKVGVAAIPVGANPNLRSVMYSDPYFVLKGSKNPEVAYQFIQFMAQTDEQQKMVQQSGGDPPANVAALETYYSFFKTIDPKEMEAVVEGSLNYSQEGEEHSIVGSAQIDTLYTNELNVIMSGSKKAKDVCPELADKMDKVLKDINSTKK